VAADAMRRARKTPLPVRCSDVPYGPGFRSYPVIWCTVAIVYAGQRLIARSNLPKSLVTRPVARGLLELRGLRFPLVTWQHRPQKALQVGPTWRLSAISAGGAGAVVAPAATTPAAAARSRSPGVHYCSDQAERSGLVTRHVTRLTPVFPAHTHYSGTFIGWQLRNPGR
jgi:hypothetical protein